jgi:hypothetical protein
MLFFGRHNSHFQSVSLVKATAEISYQNGRKWSVSSIRLHAPAGAETDIELDVPIGWFENFWTSQDLLACPISSLSPVPEK